MVHTFENHCTPQESAALGQPMFLPVLQENVPGFLPQPTAMIVSESNVQIDSFLKYEAPAWMWAHVIVKFLCPSVSFQYQFGPFMFP